jgi:hypothetical protein
MPRACAVRHGPPVYEYFFFFFLTLWKLTHGPEFSRAGAPRDEGRATASRPMEAPAALPAEMGATAAPVSTPPIPTPAVPTPAVPSAPPPPVGSLVWCKVQGYPWWPGKLLSRPSETVAKVRFFETGVDVKVPAGPAAVVGFEHKLELCDEEAIRKSCKKPALRKALTSAVQQAQQPNAAELAAAEAEAEAVAAERAAELAAAWRRDGHPNIGRRVARPFGKALAYGTITRWVRAQHSPPGLRTPIIAQAVCIGLPSPAQPQPTRPASPSPPHPHFHRAAHSSVFSARPAPPTQ